MDTHTSMETGTATRGGTANLAQQPLFLRARDARRLLRAGFTAAPIIAGVDKFTNLLCDWDQYLAPQVVSRMRPARRRSFMRVVGVVEVAAGLLVAARPQV